MIRAIYLFIFIGVGCATQAFSQHSDDARCGNVVWLHQQIVSDTLLRNKLRKNEINVQNLLANKDLTSSERQQITIPIVVHIVWQEQQENISDGLVHSQIEALNRDFSAANPDSDLVPGEFLDRKAHDTGIRFCLAATDPSGNRTGGIVRVKTVVDEIGLSDNLYHDDSGGSSAWAPEEYLNIWVANTGETISGFGTYPDLVAAEKSGVVIHPKYFGQKTSGKYNLGRTTVHEVGHYLGLLHPWGDDDDCETDDGISDTPPQEKAYTDCPTYPQFSCNHSNAFMTYMDYVDDKCMVMFTDGQKMKMLATLELFRPVLTTGDTKCSPQEKDDFTLHLFPNPAASFAQLPFAPDRVQMFNLLGQSVSVPLSNEMLDVSALPPGIYHVLAEKDGVLYVGKLTVGI